MTRATASLDVVVSGLVMKVIVSTGGGTVFKQVLLLGGISLVTGTRFRFGYEWDSKFVVSFFE